MPGFPGWNSPSASDSRLEGGQILGSMDRRVTHRALGYPLTAFVSARVDQHRLQEIESALTGIAEVVEVHGIAGGADIMIRVVAQNTDDLYRIAGVILASPGIQRTEVSLSMREMVPYRTAPLLRQRAGVSELPLP